MRKLLTGFSLWMAIGTAAPLLAQSPPASLYEKDAAMSTSRQSTVAEQRIYERASIEAHERLARIESRHRKGISVQRPAIYSGGLLATETLWIGPWHYYPHYYCPNH